MADAGTANAHIQVLPDQRLKHLCDVVEAISSDGAM